MTGIMTSSSARHGSAPLSSNSSASIPSPAEDTSIHGTCSSSRSTTASRTSESSSTTSTWTGTDGEPRPSSVYTCPVGRPAPSQNRTVWTRVSIPQPTADWMRQAVQLYGNDGNLIGEHIGWVEFYDGGKQPSRLRQVVRSPSGSTLTLRTSATARTESSGAATTPRLGSKSGHSHSSAATSTCGRSQDGRNPGTARRLRASRGLIPMSNPLRVATTEPAPRHARRNAPRPRQMPESPAQASQPRT